ncbi:MAG: nickel-dependent lactate racemase [Lentisphaerae bacterium]|nr:nickel-dependent lactate racemase [Lentisphaerota bacterium]
MKNFQLPYGKGHITGTAENALLNGVYTAQLPPAAADAVAEVEFALDNPIDSPPLEELARCKRTALIIASDHTRPVPSRILIPALLERLRKYNPDIKITILIATGCHRSTTAGELRDKFGSDIVEKEHIVIHDCDSKTDLQTIGILPSGGTLTVNKLIMETDLLLAEGFIEPHFFAGFSGGRKSVLPGVAGRQSVLANHCSEFIQSPFARTGVLANNPIHQDMLFAAEQAQLAFILNVVINSSKQIVRAFAGNMQSAHLAGCDFLKSCCQIKVPLSDIVITGNGGYPLDQNIYQCVKGMTAGEAACRKNGVIILAASCSDGHGGEEFFHVLSKDESASDLLERVRAIPRDCTTPDQWQYQILARILANFTVIMVSEPEIRPLIGAMKMQSAANLEEALAKARQLVGADGKIAVIPDGVSVIVNAAEQE